MLLTNSAQIREMDRLMIEEYDYPSVLLMETAGRLAAEKLLALYPDIHAFLILCGPGNNGGDGMVIARYLKQAGQHVLVLYSRTPEAYSGDARINYRLLRKMGLPQEIYGRPVRKQVEEFLKQGAVIVDALLGTGLSQLLREPMANQLDFFRQFRNPVVAVDLPSGLNADTGVVLNVPLRCEYTLTFQLPKICHYVTPAASYCGEVHVLDIGIYEHVIRQVGPVARLIDDELVRSWYQPRDPAGHKGTYGHVFLAGGSRGKGGAIALATQSALEIGAGLCTAFIPGSVSCAFHRNTLENMSLPYGKDSVAYLSGTAADVFNSYLAEKSAVVIGPGLGLTEETQEFLQGVLAAVRLPLVLDADALNILAKHPDWLNQLPPLTILTPHPGEMARLAGVTNEEVQRQRLELASSFAREHNLIVLLKGQHSVIALPNGTIYVNPLGNPGMASAGMGDVLAGAIGGLLAQGYTPEQATVMAGYVHARAGDRVAAKHGVEGVVATKLMRSLGIALTEILEFRNTPHGKRNTH